MLTMNFAPLVAAFATMLITTIILHSKITQNLKDIPNERSLHEIPTPRIGGVGLIAGVLSGWSVMINSVSIGIVFSLLLLFVLSLIDDVRGLSVRIRFSFHLIAATVLVWSEGLFGVNVLWSMVAVLAIVWVVNLYNFMDGSDGLAGGMALFGFSSYGVAALMGGDVVLAMMCFSIGAAALSFLYFNFYPAKIFMGDAGSIPLGFLSSSIGIIGWIRDLWPIWFPLMVFSPFVLDASATLLKRAVRGEKIWKAHREHYYQRLIQMGVGHRNVALIEYALMFCIGLSALWTLQHRDTWMMVVLVWSVVYGVAMVRIDHFWRARLD